MTTHGISHRTEKRKGAAAILVRAGPPTGNAHRVSLFWVQFENLFNPYVVLPKVVEIVLVQKSLPQAEAEIGQAHPARIIGE